jgi:cellobiose phosphorylase
VDVTQYILGIRAGMNGLAIDPCVPREWPSFSVRREFRGASYEIEFVNPRSVGRGVRKMLVDDQQVAGNVIPLAPSGSSVRVRVELG